MRFGSVFQKPVTYIALWHRPLLNHLKIDLHASNSEGRLYTYDNKVVDQNYFATAESRNYCLGLPGWYPCIDCTAKTTSSSTVTIIDDKPDEVTQYKNAEMVYSKQLKSHLLYLNRHRKRVPSEDCSENPAAATGIKKFLKAQLAMCRKSDLALILMKMIWKPLRRESVQLTLPKARNGL